MVQYYLSYKQVKKPFNPLLGETYELVDEDYRYFAEQVSHHPPITAFAYEGKGFEVIGHNHMIQSFKFGGGTGTLHFDQCGRINIKFPEYGDNIYVGKP